MQDVGIASTQFDGFIAGRTTPPADVLQKMTKYFWPNAKFDPERNILIAGNAETKPKPLRAAYPPPVTGDPNWVKPEWTGGPQPAVKVKPKPSGRPGWLGGSF